MAHLVNFKLISLLFCHFSIASVQQKPCHKNTWFFAENGKLLCELLTIIWSHYDFVSSVLLLAVRQWNEVKRNFAANKSIRSIYLQLCASTDEHVPINAKIKLKPKEINEQKKPRRTNGWGKNEFKWKESHWCAVACDAFGYIGWRTSVCWVFPLKHFYRRNAFNLRYDVVVDIVVDVVAMWFDCFDIGAATVVFLNLVVNRFCFFFCRFARLRRENETSVITISRLF